MSLFNKTGLVAWYPMTKGSGTTIYDYSGNSNDGTITGATWDKIKTGQYVLTFNGSSDYISTPNIDLNGKTFTLFCWEKKSSDGLTQFIFGNYNSSSTNNCLHFGYRSDNYFTFAFWNNDLDTANAYTGSEWRFWVGTYNASTNSRKIYLNGELENSNTASSDYLNNFNSIGCTLNPRSCFFNGKIGLCGVYVDKELSANEIKALYEKTYIE